MGHQAIQETKAGLSRTIGRPAAVAEVRHRLGLAQFKCQLVVCSAGTRSIALAGDSEFGPHQVHDRAEFLLLPMTSDHIFEQPELVDLEQQRRGNEQEPEAAGQRPLQQHIAALPMAARCGAQQPLVQAATPPLLPPMPHTVATPKAFSTPTFRVGTPCPPDRHTDMAADCSAPRGAW